MAFKEDRSLHLQLPISSPNILKSSTSLELGYDARRLGARTSVPLKKPLERTRTSLAAEAPVTYASDSITVETRPDAHQEDLDMNYGNEEEDALPPRKSKINIVDLPEEIQQCILNYVAGELGAISSRNTGNGVRNWHHALRHSRAKEQTNLALVTSSWTPFIQQRLYRHIRVEGTRKGLTESYYWFLLHPWLQNYVRHVDFWVPVWERRSSSPISHLTTRMVEDMQQPAESMQPVSSNYKFSSSSASIEEMFVLVSQIFDQACILTIEGGSCKRPPKIPLLRCASNVLPVLHNIKTLVLRGAWNMIREVEDYEQISAAVPNMKDWQVMFGSPKYLAYTVMHSVVPKLSPRLTHLHLCMDGFYSKKWLNPDKVEDLRLHHHLCENLGVLLEQLEALTFSGRACYSLFSSAVEACSNRNHITSKPSLKSIDLALRNCCRDKRNLFGEGMGVYNWGFISAFERLVLAATASMKIFANLKSMRIRFVDLDSPMASMNPFFQIKDQIAYGMYSEAILLNLMALPQPVLLAEERPSTSSHEHSYGAQSRRTATDHRPFKMHVSEYTNLGLPR